MKTNGRILNKFYLALFSGALAFAPAGCQTRSEKPPGPAAAPPPAPKAPAAPIQANTGAAAAVTNVMQIRGNADFYEALSAYGEWVVAGYYNRCWRPLQVPQGWHPYCRGQWQWTKSGWYWVTDEPWGWATYHYGRWDWTMNFGWVWVPGTQWATAWVGWREGGGYIGWAPISPVTTISDLGGVVFPDPVYELRAFTFVRAERFLDPVRPESVTLDNTRVINPTLNISRIQIAGAEVINGGPSLDAVERATGRKAPEISMSRQRLRDEMPMLEHPRHITERNVPPAASRIVAPVPAGTNSTGQPAPPPNRSQ